MIVSNFYKFTSLLLFSVASLATADISVAAIDAEKRLHKIAAENNCRIIKTAQHKEDSPVRMETEHVITTWCTTSAPGEKKSVFHILIAVKRSQHNWADCPGLIPIAATHTPPFLGISKALLNGKMENLDKFIYLSSILDNAPSSSEGPGPKSEIADGDGLNIGHWDAMQTLYCYNDKWLISEFH